MKLNIEPKQVIETLGIAAVVASLVFVGLQLRQAEISASSERSLSRVELAIEINYQINEHPAIWEAGNSGNELSKADQIIYTNLLMNYWLMVDGLALTGVRSGRAISENPAVLDFSSFLIENPG